jgi:hypothetical protein
MTGKETKQYSKNNKLPPETQPKRIYTSYIDKTGTNKNMIIIVE